MERNLPRARTWLAALATAAVGALVLVGVAGAANSGSYTDRARDAGLAADITNVDVSNDDAGTITIRLTFGDAGIPPGLPGEDLGVALDLDQNPDTGTVYYGTEVAFALDFGLDGKTLTFGRSNGANFSSADLAGRREPLLRLRRTLARAAHGARPAPLLRPVDRHGPEQEQPQLCSARDSVARAGRAKSGKARSPSSHSAFKAARGGPALERR